jgi:plasmid replication initiation protein
MEASDNNISVRDNVYQSNHITQSHLPFTKVEADIFTIILSTLQVDRTDYKYNIKQLLHYLKIEAKHYKNFVAGLNGLFEKSIIIKHSDGSIEKIRLLSRIKYKDPKNISINDDVEINISSEIKPHLFDLKKHYTIYETNSFLQLESINSKKLYTLFAQFKNTGKIRMSKNQIQEILHTNYADFSVLMAKVIKPCVAEIQSKTNVKNITIEPIKRGRIIDGYFFNFNYKVIQLELPLLPRETNINTLNQFSELTTKYKLTHHQATTIIENISYREINIVFHEVSLQMSNNKVANIGAYTLAIFRNKFNLVF